MWGTEAMSWIKMRTNLPTDGRVMFVAEQTGKHHIVILGAVAWLWMLADQHTVDGKLMGYTAASVDRTVGVRGFCDALTKTPGGPWLEIHDGYLLIVDFEKHNGESAKARACNAVRASRFRHKNVREKAHETRTVVTESAHEKRTGALPREEKIREEKKKTEEGATAKPVAAPSEAQIAARWWTDQFCDRWAACHGDTFYPFKKGRDGNAMASIREVLRGPKGEDNRDLWPPIIDRYLADRRDFTVSRGHTLHHLADSIATYIAVPTGGPNGQSHAGRGYGKPGRIAAAADRRAAERASEFPEPAMQLPIAPPLRAGIAAGEPARVPGGGGVFAQGQGGAEASHGL